MEYTEERANCLRWQKSNAEQVIRLRELNPCWTGVQIGQRVGLTRQRVDQILTKAKLQNKAWRSMIACEVCDKPTPATYGNGNPRRWCSKECRRISKALKVSCSQCGELFDLPEYLLIVKVKRGYQHLFCSNLCKGMWAGKHYGFSAQHDWDLVWYIHSITGLKGTKLARLTRIPVKLIYRFFSLSKVRQQPLEAALKQGER